MTSELSIDKNIHVYGAYTQFLKLELSRESQVNPGKRNGSVLATANFGLSSE